jgi:hypothetical protein
LPFKSVLLGPLAQVKAATGEKVAFTVQVALIAPVV